MNSQKLNSLDVEYTELWQVARAHNLAPIVFSVTKDIQCAKDQKEEYKAFQDSFYDAITRYDVQAGVMQELDKVLCQNEIKHIFFKGSKIKELYPIPELRLMGDVDVLIAQDDRDRTKDKLTSKDFELLHSNGPVYDYVKDDVLIEMHTKIISGRVGSADAEGYFLDAINHGVFDGYCGELDPSYHFEYLIAHIAHHFWFYGAGVKLILDLAIMLKSYNIDIQKVISDLSEIGLGKFARLMISICYKWFGVGEILETDTEKTEEFLLSFGAFGNVNRDKGAVIKRKALEQGDKSDFATKLKLAFPSYEKMKNIPYISFMEGKPYLLPIGWIYRIYYNLKHKKEFLIEATSTIGSKDTTKRAKEELEFFEEIELI